MTHGYSTHTLWYYRLLGPLGDPWVFHTYTLVLYRLLGPLGDPWVFHVYSGTIDTLGECVSLHVCVYYRDQWVTHGQSTVGVKKKFPLRKRSTLRARIACRRLSIVAIAFD